MRVYKLSVVMDLASQVGVTLVGRLKNDLDDIRSASSIVQEFRTLEPLVSLCVPK